jgi:hypothetical protein
LLAAFGACGIEYKKGVGSSSGGGGHVPSSTIETKTAIGCKDSDMLQVSVVPLYHLGPLPKYSRLQIESALPSLRGLNIVFDPCMCRKQARKAERISGSAAAAAASGVGAKDADGQDSLADVNSDDSDADEDMNDYVDGVLPEALTSAYRVRSPLQKVAQLSVDGELGLANPERRLLRRLFLNMLQIGKAKRRARMLWY